MPADFPPGATNAVANGYKWDASWSVWDRQDGTYPPNDSAEYIRINGGWRKKAETKIVSSASAFFSGITFTVPEGAVRAEFILNLTATSSNDAHISMGSSVFNNLSPSSLRVGWAHFTGTLAYQHVPRTDDIRWPLNHANARGNSPTHGFVINGSIMLERGSTAQHFAGWCQTFSYNTLSTALFALSEHCFYTYPTGILGNVLRLPDIKFYASDTIPGWTNQSAICVEWFY